MSKSHHRDSHHSDHHHDHDRFWDHHHAGKGFVFGTRGDDVLTGTDHNDVILGRQGNDHIIGGDGNDWLDGDKGKDLLEGGSGNDKLFGDKGSDELYGGDGNDCLFGGKGNDLLDGGAGSDKVFGGKGNDVAVYVVADHVAADVSAADDFYDGGKGHDVLRLVLTSDEMKDPGIQSDIEAFQAFLADQANGCGGHGDVFEFQNLDLVARNFEALDVETGNTPPDAVTDAYTLTEDHVLKVNPHDGVLANDSDAEGDALTAVLIDGPNHGTLDFHDDGSFEYTPNADYNNDIDGPDGFSYLANDGTDDSAVTNVVLNVTAVNDWPIPENESWSVDAGGTVKITFLPGPPTATDEANQTVELLFAVMAPQDMQDGSVALVDNNSAIEYTAPDYGGTFAIDYLVTDSGGGFNQDQVDVDVLV
jgi:Bacterial Ig domain/RTX calcium-binding nonapeptide repeat (4 copies)